MEDNYADVIGGDYLAVLALIEAEVNGDEAAWSTLTDLSRHPRQDDNWRMLTAAVSFAVRLLKDADERDADVSREWIAQMRKDIIEVTG